MSAIADIISNSNLNNNEWMYLINIARKSNKNVSFQALHYSDPVRHRIEFINQISSDVSGISYWQVRMTLSPDWYWYQWLTRAEVLRRPKLFYAFNEFITVRIPDILREQRLEKRIRSDTTEPTLELNYLFD